MVSSMNFVLNYIWQSPLYIFSNINVYVYELENGRNHFKHNLTKPIDLNARDSNNLSNHRKQEFWENFHYPFLFPIPEFVNHDFFSVCQFSISIFLGSFCFISLNILNRIVFISLHESAAHEPVTDI